MGAYNRHLQVVGNEIKGLFFFLVSQKGLFLKKQASKKGCLKKVYENYVLWEKKLHGFQKLLIMLFEAKMENSDFPTIL